MANLYVQPSPFPPSFEGNPWSYAFGLFGDVVAAALALTILLAYLTDKRRLTQISRMLGNPVKQEQPKPNSLVSIYQTGNIAILTFVVMRTLPDAMWMLAWGEVSERTIRFLLALDLMLDGLSLVPLTLAIMCWAIGRQAIPQVLSHVTVGVSGRFPWDVVLRNARIVLVVFAIAVGVTIGKANV